MEPASCSYKVTVKSGYACPARCVMGQNGKQCSGNGVCGYDEKLGSFCQCFGLAILFEELPVVESFRDAYELVLAPLELTRCSQSLSEPLRAIWKVIARIGA